MSIKVKLKIIHTFKVIQLCQFSTTNTNNHQLFPNVLSSLLINFTNSIVIFTITIFNQDTDLQ